LILIVYVSLFLNTVRGKNGLHAFGRKLTDLDEIWKGLSQMSGAGPGKFWARSEP